MGRQSALAFLAELLCLSPLLFGLVLFLRAQLYGDPLAWHFWGHVMADPLGILALEATTLLTVFAITCIALLLSHALLRVFRANRRRVRIPLALLVSAVPVTLGLWHATQSFHA